MEHIVNFSVIVEKFSEETMDELRGGSAVVMARDVQQSAAGDGAEYVCCIKIKK